MRAILAALLVCFGSVAAVEVFRDASSDSLQSSQSSSTAAPGANNKFVGTWTLIATEQRDAKGQLITPATPPPPGRLGFITYDPAGYMGVVIMQGGRQKYAGAEPTPQEARAAV